MASRRDRPADHRIGDSILRLPDGARISVALPGAGGSRGPEPCCFCGGPVEPGAAEHVSLRATWLRGSEECTQAWSAHRDCLGARVHEDVAGIGPFFIAD